ncbi:MAG: type I-F CRISPR-associated endoribonuclease Cas6/Csy4 [Nitrosomonas sp.]|nr:MAG: type I-F CRISPR-associated endoribonuclease Cas6/Csy4 [Nitrosomonas sp.]
MEYYQEITLMPNADIDQYFLWSKTFQQIHLGLVEMQDDQKRAPIGVSFPEYKSGEKCGVLGSKLRLFAPNEATLLQFDAGKWLIRLTDYVHCTGVRAVPSAVKSYAIYQREQPKTNRERLARRYARRDAKHHNLDHGIALNSEVTLSARLEGNAIYEQAMIRYRDMPHRTVATPFIRLKSLHSGHTFCLWIKKRAIDHYYNGTFSTYGFSATSTVPEF